MSASIRKRTEVSARRTRVARARLHGVPLREIAEDEGVSLATASRDMAAALADWHVARNDLNLLLTVEHGRLEEIDAQAAAGFALDGHPRWLAIRLMTAARRAKLLGLDQPATPAPLPAQRVEVVMVGRDGQPVSAPPLAAGGDY